MQQATTDVLTSALKDSDYFSHWLTAAVQRSAPGLSGAGDYMATWVGGLGAGPSDRGRVESRNPAQMPGFNRHVLVTNGRDD